MDTSPSPSCRAPAYARAVHLWCDRSDGADVIWRNPSSALSSIHNPLKSWGKAGTEPSCYKHIYFCWSRSKRMGNRTPSLILAWRGACRKVPHDYGEVTTRETDVETHPAIPAHPVSRAPALTGGFVPSKSFLTPRKQTKLFRGFQRAV